jgi:hypothetical protein
MTDTTPPATPDPDNSASDISVGGSIEVDSQGQVAPDAGGTVTQEQKVNPATGQPYPPMGVPVNADSADEVTDNPDEVPGDRVYMSLVWMNVNKDEALRIRDAALAAAGELTSYSVEFSAPVGDY